jgi:hypothetical protein
MDDHKRETREYWNSFIILLATTAFVAAHFHIGNYEVGFWLGVTFNLMVAFGVAVRK